MINDIYFAAYLVNNEVALDSFELVDGKYMSFKFNLTSEEMDKKKIEFLKSDYNLIKRQISELRSLGRK